MNAIFDPPVFRYTVRMPESRRGRLKNAAGRFGLTEGQLVQALVDRIDLTDLSGNLADAARAFEKMFPRHETTRELSDRANSVGLTARELKVFRVLAQSAGMVGMVRPDTMDVTARSGVSEGHLDTIYDRLVEKGFLAVAPSQGRGRRIFAIARMPDI